MDNSSLSINGPNVQSRSLNPLNSLNNAVNTNSRNNIKSDSKAVNNDNNNQTSSAGIGGTQNSNNAVKNDKTKEEELSNQIQSDISPTPMLSQAMLFKWDSSAGAAVVNVVDFKTGKVLAQIPPEQVLKVMSNYQKGSLYNNKA
jgi:uncharacterized FlaG/YvyC family protein